MWFILVILMLLVQACSKGGATEEDGPGPALPETIEVVKVMDGEGAVLAEHRDSNDIAAIVAGLQHAERTAVGDPEPSGDLYKLEFIGKDKQLTLSLMDFRMTNGMAPSAKVYAAGLRENETKAWSLSTAWVQQVLAPTQPDNKEHPIMMVTIHEDSDSVVLYANQAVDRGTVEHAIQTTIHDANGGMLSGYRYAVEWSDDQRALVRFTELPPESAVGFMLEGSKTKDGNPLEVVLPYEGRVVVVRAGLPWSGIRTVNTQGDVIHEHAFDSVSLIQAPGVEDWGGKITLYYHDGTVDQLEPDTGEVFRTDAAIWPDEQTKNMSDSGASGLYAFAKAGDNYYIAHGLEQVYRFNRADGTNRMIYQSGRAIYGMAASPDGRHVALLADSEGTLGPYANLLVVDAAGKLVAQYEKASYIGHSDGWHIIYPVAWRDNETIAVPLIARPDLEFDRGKAIYRIREGLAAEEEGPVLPDDALALLKTELPDWSGEEMDIIRALPMPNDADERYFAAQIAGYGSFIIDRLDEKVMKVGAGALLGWTATGNILIWYSTEGQSPEIAIMD